MNPSKDLGMTLVLLTLFLASCANPPSQANLETNPEPTPPPRIRVNAVQAQEGTITEWLTFNGNVEAFSTVPILPDTAGRIVELPLRPGDRVEQGQVLGRIDPSRPGLQYSLSPILSPISGTIVNVISQVGAMGSPQSPVATVAQISDLKIVTQIPERFIFRLALGNQAQIFTESLPGTQFNARVTEISPVLNPLSRTAEVTLLLPRGQSSQSLPNNQGQSSLRPGMFVEVRVLARQANQTLIIPKDGVVFRNDQTFVFVLEEGQAELRPVTLGIDTGTQVQILSGLNPGDLVATTGKNVLYPGAPVTIINHQ